MKEYKTVKQVCEITGLNRKLLHIYDKAGVVKPSSYQNPGHEGTVKKTGVKVNYDGYKLYDDEAVRKLIQIAIYEKLHIKRCEIIACFKAKENNTSDLLDEQIQLLKQKEKEIKELRIVAERLKMLGMKGTLSNYYPRIDFSEFAKNAEKWENSRSFQIMNEVASNAIEKFDAEVVDVRNKLLSLSANETDSEDAIKIVKELFAIVKKHLGFVGWLFILFIAMGVEERGDAVEDIFAEYGEERVINSIKAVWSYYKYDMEIFWEEYADVFAKHYDAIGKDYKDPNVKEMVGELKSILFVHTGMCSNQEYEMFFELMQMFSLVEIDDSVSFAVGAMEYYFKTTNEGGNYNG